MIPIERTLEPDALRDIRDSEVTRVEAKLAQGGKLTGDLVGKAYKPMTNELRRMQFEKCCYCEWREQADNNDVEHYRPKAEAIRGPAFLDTSGYWWLAWTWENLLFACSRCNRSEKNSDFPLGVGSQVLSRGASAPGGEFPLLLDPTGVDSPFHHMRFLPFDEGGRTRWKPFVANNSLRGIDTIRVLGLDRDALVEDYSHHVRRNVQPRATLMNEAIATEDRAKIHAEWERVTRDLLSPWEQFVALAHDALAYFVPEADRVRWGLDLEDARKRHWETGKLALAE